MIRALLLVLALAGQTACAPFQAPPPQAVFQQVAGVPFVPQQQNDDCGPAALASLLGHRGLQVDPAQISASVYDPRLGGSLLPDLENFARARGFATRSGRGDLNLVRQQVEEGHPVLLPIEAGFGPLARPHYLVVFGFSEAGFLAHAGVAPARYFPAADFDSRWAAMNRLYLILE